MESKPILLVTGASGGLGKVAIEYFLAKNDFLIVGCSRSKVEINHPNYFHVESDLSKQNAVTDLITQIQKKYGRIDFLINAIGVSHSKLNYFTSESEIFDVFNVNTLLPLKIIKESAKLMAKKGFGKILNLSTIHVTHATVGTALYSGSKSALEQITRVLASELIGSKIYLNCLRLSAVENTGMTNTLTNESKNQLLNNTIFKREVKVSEFTGALNFLLSSEANGICGQIITLGDL